MGSKKIKKVGSTRHNFIVQGRESEIVLVNHSMVVQPHERVVIFVMGDFHLGTLACDEDALKADIDFIANTPNAVVILIGDMIDGHDRKHPYDDESMRPPWLYGVIDVIEEQEKEVGRLLRPIQDKIALILSGNHEQNQRRNGRDTYYNCAFRIMEGSGRNPLDVMGGYNAYLHLSIAHQYENSVGVGSALDIFAHHGHGGGRSAGAPQNLLASMMADHHANIYATGHQHKRATHLSDILTVNTGGKSMRQMTRLGVMTASYMRTHLGRDQRGSPKISYANVKNYAPSQVGCTPIVYNPMTGIYQALMGNHRLLSDLFPDGFK